MAGIPQVITEDRASGAQFIEGTLKFDQNKRQYLTRKPTADGNRRLWTWSGWLKRNPPNLQDIFSAGQESTNDGIYSRLRIQNDSINLRQWVNGSLDSSLISSRVFRDTSAFFHFVMIYDVDNSTNTDKVRWYINGQRVTSFSATDYPGNPSWINSSSKTHTIGGHYDGGGSNADSFWDGNMSQVYFIDGQALGPENFAYTDPLTNTWRPKKFDIKAEVSKNPNNGTTWSSTTDSGLTYADGVTGIFDGNLSTRGGAPSTNNNYAILTNNVSISCTNGIRIYWNGVGSGQRYIRINGTTEIDNGSAQLTPNWSPLSPFSGTINKIEVKSASSGSWSLAAIEVDGYILIDGSANNSFYLPMDGNSPIGEDKSGVVTPNDGTVWSDFSTASNINGGNVAGFFQGDTSSCSSLNLGTSGVFLLTKDIPNVRKIGVHSNTGAAFTMKVNEGLSDAYTVTVPSRNNVSILDEFTGFTGTIHTLSFSGFGAGVCLNAIEINGHLLVDGKKGNGFTPVNFGGSVELPKATGAIPILNANEAGTVAKGGVRTDSKTYTVTASGGNYYIDGALKPTLNAYRGSSLTFDYTGATSHPFYLSSLQDGKWNSKAYSVLFDGSGDYLSVPSSSDFDFGSGDCTVECFVYITSHAGDKTIIGSWEGTTSWQLSYGADSGNDRFAFMMHDGSSTLAAISSFQSTNYVNQWVHLAGVRHGNWLKVYVNGVFGGERSISGAHTTFNAPLTIGGRSNGNQVTGYVSNVRVVKGTALYTAAFEPPNTTLTNVTGTTLLCCQESNAATAAVIPSGSITVSGNAAATNSRNPFLYDTNGYYGVNTGTSNTTKITIPHLAVDTLYYYCNAHSGMGSSINVTTDIFKADPYAWKCVYAVPLLGIASDESNSLNVNSATKAITTTGASPSSIRNFYGGSFNFSSGSSQYLTTADSDDFDFGNGDFTIEAFIEGPLPASRTNSVVLNQSVSGASSNSAFYFGCGNDGVSLYLSTSGNSWTNSIEHPQTLGNTGWHHIVWQRRSNTLEIYVDGIRVKTGSFSGTINNSSRVVEIGRQSTSGSYFNGRIQDVRAYKGVAKYTENFVVGSTAPDVLPDTPSGVSGKSKLTKITEGAVAFDGSNDNLTITAHSDLDLSSGDFTVEGFVYPQRSQEQSFVTNWNSGGQFQVQMSSSGTLQASWAPYSTSQYAVTGTTPIRVNAWSHFAYTRSGSTFELFLDGVSQGTQTSSANGSTNNNIVLGENGGNADRDLLGFLSNVRIIKGTALYTSDFTPPTRELTNVTNTKLLCCQSPTFAVAAAVAPGTFVNDGTNYSSGSQVTGSTGLNYVDSLFDGRLRASGASAGDAATVNSSSDNYILWTPNTGIPYSSKVEVYCYAANGYSITNYYSFNGGSETTFTGGSSNFNGNNWITVATGSGTINSIKIRITRGGGNSTSVHWYAVRVDGTVLINDYSGKAIPRFGAAATTFNPFTDDINTIRGQETGYATWNPLSTTGVVNTSGGNLVANTVENGNGWAVSTIPMTSGKYYCEMTFEGEMSHNTNFNYIGIVPTDIAGTYAGLDIFRGLGALSIESNSSKVRAAIGTGSGATQSDWNTNFGYDESSTIGIAIDCDTPRVKFYVDGKDVGTYPYAMAANKSWFVFCNDWASGYQDFEKYILNAGQKPFKFPPPDGFQPMNLSTVQPEKVIARPDQYVDVSLWSGNGNSQIITGLKHKPDFVWIKKRAGGSARSHQLFDSVRGVYKTLHSNSAGAEDSNTNRLTAFNQDGFAVGSDDGSNGGSGTFVGWTWKAGGDKNTFNIDDVGYANASDVNMNVGGLNSSLYNSSQTWSTYGTQSGDQYSNNNGTYVWADVFDNLSDNPQDIGYCVYGPNQKWTFTNPVSVSSSVALAVWGLGRLTLNAGETDEVTLTSGGEYYNTITDTSLAGATLKNIQLDVGTAIYLFSVHIDGARLVDPNIAPDTPSIAPTGCSVGTKQGFSIIKYTSNGTQGATIPHGLTQKPDFAIFKNLDSTLGTNEVDWGVYHSALGATKNLELNQTLAEGTYPGPFNNTEPTSSVFTFGGSPNAFGHSYLTNGPSGDDFIAYIWHDVPGLQKFGSYINPTSSQGAFVDLGFKPAVLIYKCARNISSSSGAGDWMIIDTTRSPVNNPSDNNTLVLNVDNAEDSYYTASQAAVDILSNGFKIRHPNSSPGGDPGRLYIYAAWAEAPSINLYGGQSNAR